MDRITEKKLEAMCERLNILTGSPLKPYIDGKPQAGNYHLSHAYGGVCLHRVCGTGGVTTPLYGGHSPKRDLYDRLWSYIRGIEDARKEINHP